MLINASSEKGLKPEVRYLTTARFFCTFVSCALLLCLVGHSKADELGHGPGYAVQAGLYVGPIQSNRMAEELVNAGYAAWVEERPQGQGRTHYYVLVGPFAEEPQAAEAVNSIRGKFNIDPFIVDLNQR